MNTFSIAVVGQPEIQIKIVAKTLSRLWAGRRGKCQLTQMLSAAAEEAPSVAELLLFKTDPVTGSRPIDLMLVTDWSQYRRFEDQRLITHDTIIFCDQITQIPSHLLMRCGFIHQVSGLDLLAKHGLQSALPVFFASLLGRLIGCSGNQLKDAFKLIPDMTRHQGWEAAVKIAEEVILPAYLDGMVDGLLPSKGASALERHPLFSALHELDDGQVTADVNKSSSSRVPSHHTSAYNGEHSGGHLPVH